MAEPVRDPANDTAPPERLRRQRGRCHSSWRTAPTPLPTHASVRGSPISTCSSPFIITRSRRLSGHAPRSVAGSRWRFPTWSTGLLSQAGLSCRSGSSWRNWGSIRQVGAPARPCHLFAFVPRWVPRSGLPTRGRSPSFSIPSGAVCPSPHRREEADHGHYDFIPTLRATASASLPGRFPSSCPCPASRPTGGSRHGIAHRP